MWVLTVRVYLYTDFFFSISKYYNNMVLAVQWLVKSKDSELRIGEGLEYSEGPEWFSAVMGLAPLNSHVVQGSTV